MKRFTLAMLAAAAVSMTAGPVLAQCSGSGVQIAADCGSVTFEGCCTASGTSTWCEGGVLCEVNCQDNTPPGNTCGWDVDNGFYDCGQVGPDPSCANPYHCEADQCQECGSLGVEACCDGQTVQWCMCSCLFEFDCSANDAPNDVCGWRPTASFYGCGGSGSDPSGTYPLECGGGPCVPDCGGKQCGSDGCDGTCGTCPAGYTCNASGICDACSCDGKQCGSDGCGGSCGTCDANYYCDATGLCAVCTCIGKECGTDECGNPCGSCAVGNSCVAGKCVPDCVPDCAGKACGPDGCGGTCGTCPIGQDCSGGQCVLPRGVCGADPTETCQGSCGGPSDGSCYCDEACLDYGDCCPDYQDCCGGACVPDCQFNDCGDDGCGGSCGTCPAGEECTFGSCFPCIPDCFLKDCGDDGCGGSCGTCPAGQTCGILGTCSGGSCTPDCLGKDCGPDGCGGSCGTCPAGQGCQTGTCVAGDCGNVTYEGCCEGQLVKYCEDSAVSTIDCSTNTPPDDQCGWKATEGYYDCGGSGADPSGTLPLACSGCTSDCTGKSCGDDGCGGSCGTCSAGQACQYGVCVACTPDCTGKDCGDDGCGGTCGTCAQGFTCKSGTCTENQVCVPDCAGKECGSDGCEGVCGVCTPPKKCGATGTCYDPSACTPDCSGRECGTDGCGGECGQCGAGLTCNALGKCATQDTPDAGGPSPADKGPGQETGGQACPAGYVLFYGKCKAVDGTDDGVQPSGSNCSAGTVTPPGTGFSSFAVAVIALFALAMVRIRGGRSKHRA